MEQIERSTLNVFRVPFTSSIGKKSRPQGEESPRGGRPISEKNTGASQLSLTNGGGQEDHGISDHVFEGGASIQRSSN